MYEFSIAAKYLLPKWRQLSVSIISLISIFVIAVVVWLIVVFFSVTNGLTNGWLDKLTTLTAPVRITPTKEYYQSYFYLIDGISSEADYSLKTIGEKRLAQNSDPYSASMDEEIPPTWSRPDLAPDGQLKDPVKLAFRAIQDISNVKGLTASEHEAAIGNLHLRLWRPQKQELPTSRLKEPQQGHIAQATYVGSLDPFNSALIKTVIPPSHLDLSNLLLSLSYDNYRPELNESVSNDMSTNKNVSSRLKGFFEHLTIRQLRTTEAGWTLPYELLPAKADWGVIALLRNETIMKVILPKDAADLAAWRQKKSAEGYLFKMGRLKIDHGNFQLSFPNEPEKTLPVLPALLIPGDLNINAELISASLDSLKTLSDLLFQVNFKIQGSSLAGVVKYGNLGINRAQTQSRLISPLGSTPLWAYTLPANHERESLHLPIHPTLGEGVILPKSFREAGALLGDMGYISYHAASPTGIHEQQIPVFIAGFYDPGIIPMGGKYIIANQQVTSQIRASYNQEENLAGNGINLRFENREQADKVKSSLQKSFDEAGIANYWKIETFREFEFTRDVIQQLQSDKHLFSLLAALIIIVACSNIISMLIILVNDKKVEIGILRSMGASSLSMAMIFGSCGVMMGVIGSFAGIVAAVVTLKNLQPIINFISWIQGYEMFNPMFYGENLPTDLSFETLTFVIGMTGAISLIAGIIPAIKACLLKPAAILKAE